MIKDTINLNTYKLLLNVSDIYSRQYATIEVQIQNYWKHDDMFYVLLYNYTT